MIPDEHYDLPTSPASTIHTSLSDLGRDELGHLLQAVWRVTFPTVWEEKHSGHLGIWWDEYDSSFSSSPLALGPSSTQHVFYTHYLISSQSHLQHNLAISS